MPLLLFLPRALQKRILRLLHKLVASKRKALFPVLLLGNSCIFGFKAVSMFALYFVLSGFALDSFPLRMYAQETERRALFIAPSCEQLSPALDMLKGEKKFVQEPQPCMYFSPKGYEALLEGLQLVEGRAAFSFSETEGFALNMQVCIRNRQLAKDWDFLLASSAMRFSALWAEGLNLSLQEDVKGVYNSLTEETVYSFSVPLSQSKFKQFLELELESLQISWKGQKLLLELYDLDFFYRRSHCLLRALDKAGISYSL